MWGKFVALVLAVWPAFSSAQVYKSETARWFTGSSDFALPFEVGALVQGPMHTLVLIGANGTELAVLDPASGSVGRTFTLKGETRSIAADALDRVAVVSESADGKSHFELLTITDKVTLSPVQTLAARAIERMADPMVLFVSINEGKGGTVQHLLALDAGTDIEPAERTVFMMTGKGLVRIPGESWPGLLVPIGRGSALLGLDDFNRAAVIQDAETGEVRDAVAFSAFTPEMHKSLSMFVPNQPQGGAPNILLLESDTSALTILSLEQRDRPLIAPILRVPLNVDSEFGKGAGDLIAASDHDVQLIVAGAVGSSTVRIFRRLKGALDPDPGTILHDWPLRAMTAVTGPGGSHETVFAFLSADGLALSLKDLAFVEGWSKSAREIVPTSNQILELTTSVSVRSLSTADVQRLQRTLAVLGYKVGTVDGMPGPQTIAALKTFQSKSGLEPTGTLDQKTSEALEAALTSGLKNSRANTSTAEFEAFLSDALGRPFDGSRLLTLGEAAANPDNPCFGLNDVAPKVLWPNAVKFANLLRRIEERNLKVEVVTGYQTPAAGRCLSPLAPEQHAAFMAFDIRLAGDTQDPKARAEGIDMLAKIVKELQADALTSVDIAADALALHIVTRIGKVHATISSYPVSERSCALAIEDVAEFASLLAGTGLAGLEVMVTRQIRTERYIVSVDANGSARLADNAAALIRKVSSRSADTRTGNDSTPLKDEGLAFDPDCAAVMVIPAGARAE
jgi:hypothetical protein